MAREEKMVKRRETGKSYSYKKNPYKKGTKEYAKEKAIRKEKNLSKKMECVHIRSIMSKLNYQLEKESQKRAKKKTEKKGIKNDKRASK